MADTEDPIDLAKKFWNALWENDKVKGMGIINGMISPDCYLKDGFGTSARGVHDTEAISAKLSELSGKITGGAATFERSVSFQLMRNRSQVRFLTSAKLGWITAHIGFALEFESGFIVKLVIMKNPGKGVFENDDTKEAPLAVVHEVEESNNDKKEEVEQHKKKNEIVEANIKTDSERCSTSSSAEEIDMGNFLKGQKPHQNVDEREQAADLPLVPLADTLHPPFLTSKPPHIPPTVVVTVIGCMHLKSPLKRVIKRDVDAYVAVQIKDEPVIQSTPVANTGPNPMFTVGNKFVFEAPSFGGHIMFTVYDKRSVGDDLVIAEVHVPLASLPTTSPNNSSPTALSLPLQMVEKQVSMFSKQKRRPSVSSGGKSEFTDVDGELGTLDVQVSKIDIMKWWALEELKARDEARDRKEAEEAAARLKAEKSKKKDSKSKVDDDVKSNGNKASKEEMNLDVSSEHEYDSVPLSRVNSTDSKWEDDNSTELCRW